MVDERNKIVQKSIGFKKRQLDFIKYCDGKTFECEKHDAKKVIFKADKFFRDSFDKQIKVISEENPEVRKFL